MHSGRYGQREKDAGQNEGREARQNPAEMDCPLLGGEELALLMPWCRKVDFAPGGVLRQRGLHYRDMLLILEGEVRVDLGKSGAAHQIMVGPGNPIGEIGFLQGLAATADVSADIPVSALELDDHILEEIGREYPQLLTSLLRRLASTAEDRTSYNLLLSEAGAAAPQQDCEIRLCRDEALLTRARQLRYEVYCRELNRQSPGADHEHGTWSDALDDFGYVFVALEGGEVIGTLRANLSSEGDIGFLETLYNMRGSAHHPDETAICTKFVIRRANRVGLAAMKLVAAVVAFGLQHGVAECYIDCIPSLKRYYQAMGFTPCGPEFLHRENGPSYPMKLDMKRHGRTLSR